MLRNAVLHLANEQPLLADLFEMPTSGDVTVRLTNLRTLDGKRPIFVDDLKSVFVFPYHRVTFIEIPPQAALSAEMGDAIPVPVAVGASGPDDAADTADDGELEIDEDFLRRIREV
jgi:hypothetical protein